MDTSSHYKTKRLFGYSSRHFRRIVKKKTQKDGEVLIKVENNEQSDSSEISTDESNNEEYGR